jgi:peptide/nickel transport system substrate-binding protein
VPDKERALVTTENYWQRFQRQRLSRRRLLATAGLGAAGLVAVTACGGGEEEPAVGQTPGVGETPAAGVPKRGGRYKGVNTGDWGTIDPVTSVGTSVGITPRMYNVLLNRSNANPDFWYFDLAESLEQPDDVTYIYKLRRGVKIAPNNLGIPERDMDSSDVLSWDKRVREDEDALARVVLLPWVESTEAPDAQTVITKTKGPYGYFITRQGRALGGCIPPREFYEQGISLTDQGVGAGRYVLRPGGYEETGSVIFDRNPNYYRKDEATGEQLPYPDGFDVVLIGERQARRTAFLDGQIYNYTAESGAEADEILRQDPDVYRILNPVFTFISFTMNPLRKPWDDDRIRKAALYALDRKQFIDLVVGEGGGKPNGLVHWSTGRYAFDEEELEEFQPYDPERSRELIRAATGQDTIRVKITYPVTEIEWHHKHLPIFLQQMKEAGFDIEEDPKDFGTWLGDYTRVRYDASLSPNQIYETPEIALDWQSSKGPQGDENFAVGIGAVYPEIDEAIMASKRETDPEKQIEAVRDAQRLVYEKGPSFLPIFTWQDHVLYRNFVKNVPVALGDTGTFADNRWLDL